MPHDSRAETLELEIRETFALAMADFQAVYILAAELPALAARYRETGDVVLLQQIQAQLEEMAGWSPLQRPGWSLCSPGERLPPDGKDGNWLATGLGIRAIYLTLKQLPEGALPAGLIQRLEDLLEAEVASIVEDWEMRRPWFVQADNPITNQWVLPTEGLVLATLFLGTEKHKEAYELGVRNLLRSLDSYGAEGEFPEGVHYAKFTVTSLIHAAQAMSEADERRASDHPFLKHFPTWFVHHWQPGDAILNAFDGMRGWGAREFMRPMLKQLSETLDSPVARWALDEIPASDAPGAPPLFAHYEQAARVNWRSGWENNASGFWMRGGHPLDQHDHQDRGHVNFIRNGAPVLIETGSPDYGLPGMLVYFASGMGHNVLQLGAEFPANPLAAGAFTPPAGWQQNGVVAPIEVHRLDEKGGDVEMVCREGYKGMEFWRRRAVWDAAALEVRDSVELDSPQVVLLRWHLASDGPLEVTGSGNSFTVRWPGNEARFEADHAIEILTEPMRNATLPPAADGSLASHTCLVVRSKELVSTFALRSQFNAQ